MANERATTEMGGQNSVPKECDQVTTVLGEISSMLDASTLDGLLRRRADLASDEGIVGATTTIEEEFLLEDEHNDDFDNGSEERSEGVEKSVFSIWVDLLLCRSIQLLVLSYAEIFVYMYLSQLMSTFTNYLKVHHLLDGFFIP